MSELKPSVLRSCPHSQEGFHFRPIDGELITHYLSKKIRVEPLPWNVIKECDLYGRKAEASWEIYYYYRENDKKSLFIFTKLKDSSTNRHARSTAFGEWHGNDAGKKIYSSRTKKLIGLKKRFTFKPTKAKKDVSTLTSNDETWIMREYSLAGASLVGNQKNSECILCQILKHNKGKRKDTDGGNDSGNLATILTVSFDVANAVEHL
ncbi:NAC domain-containing protein 83-like [Hevea brasiliensis]|uniref:NAC domain-containing protein 83-like n=1 Tax=Hevea brasiliensis TaxID=3981 RepID=UPI0025D93956|nr:NAC domain-containing protein 83-like [Hevea brasiliensis]